MSALRQLQHRADDLAECLMIFELEMRRSRTLNKRMEAFRSFSKAVDRIDVLRRDAEELLPNERWKDDVLAKLDKRAANAMRSPAYKVAEWFDSQCGDLGWMIDPATIDPVRLVTMC
jgi:hypothetical protein